MNDNYNSHILSPYLKQKNNTCPQILQSTKMFVKYIVKRNILILFNIQILFLNILSHKKFFNDRKKKYIYIKKFSLFVQISRYSNKPNR